MDKMQVTFVAFSELKSRLEFEFPDVNMQDIEDELGQNVSWGTASHTLINRGTLRDCACEAAGEDVAAYINTLISADCFVDMES